MKPTKEQIDKVLSEIRADLEKMDDSHWHIEFHRSALPLGTLPRKVMIQEYAPAAGYIDPRIGKEIR
jgi:hypothetical protein